MDPPSQNSQELDDLLEFLCDVKRNWNTKENGSFVPKKTDNTIGLDSKRDDIPIHNARSNSRPAIANETWHALNMITKAEEGDRHERVAIFKSNEEILKTNQQILKTNQEILKTQAEARKQRGEVMDRILRAAPRDQNKGN